MRMKITLVAALTLLLPLTLTTFDNRSLSQTPQYDEAIYASELMTVRERDRLRKQLRSAQSDQEREQIRDRHREKMQMRAWDEGLNPDNQPLYGGHLLRQQERDQYRRQLREAASAEERERLRERHRNMVVQRAKERGEKLGKEPVYGGALMSRKERKNYRKSLRRAQSAQDRERIRHEHRQRMQVQAWERGLNPDHEPIFGGRLLTRQERDRFREQMRSAASAEERERVRAEHRTFMQERARDRGETLVDGPIYGGSMLNNQQRSQYRQMMRNAQSAEERERMRATHRELMHRHTWERGVYPGRDPVYGGYMMSQTGRTAYRARLRDASSDQERDRIRAAQRDRIRDRAMQNGIETPGPAIFGGQMMNQRERRRYQKRLAATQTAGERQRVREKNLDRMRDRARKQLRDGTGPGMDGMQMRNRIERGMDAGGSRRGQGRKGG